MFKITKKAKIKTPAANARFHASGGAASSDTEQVTSSFALVRAVAMPPPAWSRHHVSSNARATVRYETEIL